MEIHNIKVHSLGIVLTIFALMLAISPGTALAAPVSIGGNVCAGNTLPVFDANGAPVLDPLTGGQVYEPDMSCSPVSNATVMVQSGSKIVAYGTVDPATGAWSAAFDDGDGTAADNYRGHFTVMYSAPGFDATHRDYDTRGAASTQSAACAHVMCQNAYLPPLDGNNNLPTAKYLVYAFQDEYLNSEDDFPADRALNCVKVSAYNEDTGDLVEVGYTGTQPVAMLPIGKSEGFYYFGLKTNLVTGTPGLEPGHYGVKADSSRAKLPTVDVNGNVVVPTEAECAGSAVDASWIQNSSLEGGYVEEMSLYPGDPGTMAGGYLSWFSFIHNVGNTPQDPAEQGAYSITGVMRDADGMFNCAEPWGVDNPYVTSNGPIENALVVLWDQNGHGVTPPVGSPQVLIDNASRPHVVATAYTNADGRYTFSGVASGNYKLFYVSDDLDYIWQEAGVTVANANVDVGFLHMPRWWARIEGYVLNVDGLADDHPAVDTKQLATHQAITYDNLNVGWGCIDPATGQTATSPTTVLPTYTVCETTLVGGVPTENCVEKPMVTIPRGTMPPGAVPMAGQTVALRAKDGSIWKTAVTDYNGFYQFSDLGEIEVLGYVTVEQPNNMHGRIITESLPTLTNQVHGILAGENRKFTVPYKDYTDMNTYNFNLAGRSLNWFANNYMANIQLDPIPVTTADARGYVYYDSLPRGTWVPDGVYDKEHERVFAGIKVNLYEIDLNGVKVDSDLTTPAIIDPVATVLSGDKDETALQNQGFKSLGNVFPADEFAGVYKGDTIGYYEFRNLVPGTEYVVEVDKADIDAKGYLQTASSDGSVPFTAVGGTATEANLGISTGSDGTVLAASGHVPLSGEIEGGVFDDLNLQTDGESILWDEKRPLIAAPVSVYDHLGYFLGAGKMGNDLCSPFSDHVTDPNVCPDGEEAPEMEYHAAPGPHIFVGNDPSEFLTNYEYTTPDGQMNDANGFPMWETDADGFFVLDANGNQIPLIGPTYAPGTRTSRNNPVAPWLPGGTYYPEFEPLPWTYTFDQGKYKYEADWSLLPFSIGVPLPDPIRGGGSLGGLLGNGVIAPQDAPIITSAVVENVDPTLAPSMPVMLAMNDALVSTLSDADNMLAMLPAYTVNNSSGSNKVMHIHGMNFGSTKEYSTVTLSGTQLHVWKWSDTTIDVLLPEHAKSGPMMVATSNGISNTLPVNVVTDNMHERDHHMRSIYVDADYGIDGPGSGPEANPFKTIGAALEALPNVSPVYVFVKPGVYKERVTIARSGIKLIGYGPKETILDGAVKHLVINSLGASISGGQVISIGAGGIDGSVEDIVISGFTIINGSHNPYSEGGGGIFGAYGNRDIDINNNIITRNGGMYGGGIWLHNSNHDVSIWSNLIAMNGNTGGYGGGISVNEEPEYEVPGVPHGPGEFDAAHHTYDDAMYDAPTGTYTIFNNRIVRNFSMDYGGGISLYEIKDQLNVYGNMFVENKADDHGGGLFYEDSGPSNIYGNVFLWNHTPDDGGAISLEDVGDDNSVVNIYNNLIAENMVDDRGENTAIGGAIGLDDTLYINVFGNSIVGNVTAGIDEPRGGAIGSERHGHEYEYAAPGFSDAKVSNNIIWSNWRLKYQAPKPSLEGLNYSRGVNYTWTEDNLFNDDPRTNSEWESTTNSNSFTVVEGNIISGGYTGVTNVNASTVFPDPATLNHWVLKPGSAPGGLAPTVDLQETLDTVKPGYYAALSFPALANAYVSRDSLRQSLLINKDSDVSNLALAGGGSATTVNLTTSYENSLFNVSSSVSTGLVEGVNFPLGVISYNVSSPTHGCIDTMFSFSTPLPERLMLYNVSRHDEYEEVPYRRWTQTGADSLSITLCDKDDHDDDHDANGMVSGKIAIGDVFNAPPVAVAGPNQSIYLGQSLTLDGSGSYDDPADGTPVTSYEWAISKRHGGSAVIADPVSAITTFTPDKKGEYMISLQVGDGLFISPEDTMMVRVIDNKSPEAELVALPDVGMAPFLVTLDASASSDEDSNALTYEWNFGDGSVQNTGAVSSVTHTYTTSGKFKALVTVTDDFGNSDRDSVKIRVNAGNTPPSVDPSADRTGVAPAQVVNFEANAEDTESNIVSYHWDFGDGNTSVEADPSHIYTVAGTYTAVVTVSDGEFTADGSVVITVGSLFDINVTQATLKSGKKSHRGAINLKGTFTSGQPGATDVIKVVFDGVTLVEAPFSAFVSESADKYEYKAKGVHVKFNFVNSTLKVSRHKVDVGDVNNKNGIDVVISIGDNTATDSFKMKGKNGKMRYKLRK